MHVVFKLKGGGTVPFSRDISSVESFRGLFASSASAARIVGRFASPRLLESHGAWGGRRERVISVISTSFL